MLAHRRQTAQKDAANDGTVAGDGNSARVPEQPSTGKSGRRRKHQLPQFEAEAHAGLQLERVGINENYDLEAANVCSSEIEFRGSGSV